MQLSEQDKVELQRKAEEVAAKLGLQIKTDPEIVEWAQEEIHKLSSEAQRNGMLAGAKAGTTIGGLDIPKSAKQAGIMAVLISAVAGALVPLAMVVADSESKKKIKVADGPGVITRDQMLFAALFAIASENITDEGHQDTVYAAASFVEGNDSAFPSEMAHKQFELIRGYPFKSAGILARSGE